jgi:peptidoglycan hydrolase-like protein with peptidoglycan-binding domain
MHPNGKTSLYDIQAWLFGAGFLNGPVDGLFGPHTWDAIRKFQMEAGLPVDGELGPVTYRALEAAGAGSAGREAAVQRASAFAVKPQDMAMARAGLERAVALLEED